MPVNHKQTYHNQSSFITNENLSLEITQSSMNDKLNNLTDINTKLDNVNSNLNIIDNTLNSGISSLDTITHIKLDNVNSNLNVIDNSLKTLIEERNTYSLLGKNNELVLDVGGDTIYADTVPIPTISPDNKEGWFYTNDNQGNKFNYYYFSNTGFNLVVSDIKAQFCVFENLAITTNNVNVLLAIHGGNFFTGPKRVFTSNQRIEPGVKFLVYWGEDPQVFKELPRIEYTLASERNWNDAEQLLTLSVGSDSGYTAGTIANLMSHVGYVDNTGSIVSRLIGSKDNINSGGQLVKLTKDLNTNTSNVIALLQESIISMVSGFVSLGNKLDTLISLQDGGGGGGENGGGGGSGVELRSIIPDVDSEGEPLEIGGGLKVYTWEFVTGEATQYDLYAATNDFVVGDNERIFTMYFANDFNETNILDPTNFFSKNQEQIGMSLVNDEYVITFSNSMSGESPQAEITLNTNSTYNFKISTTFNDDDTVDPDVRFAITLAADPNALQLNYISVV